MNQEKINFRVDRDFGETFNASLKFLKQNFKLLFKSILFIAGPFILLSAIAGAYYSATAVQNTSLGGSKIFGLGAQYGLAYFVFIIAAAAANLALIATVFSFMITYYEKGPNNFSLADVRKVASKSVGHVAATFFTLLLYILLAVIVLGGIGFIFGSISIGLGILYAFLIIVGLLIIGPPIMWVIHSVYLIKMHEGGNAFFAFGRSRDVLKDNFWWTWVIMVCGSLGVGLVAGIFTLPQIVYTFVLSFTNASNYGEAPELSIPFMIVAGVCTFCSTILYSVLYIISGFHYYSLAEKKEGKGMFERINEIGQKPNNDVQQHY